ncbi:MAG: hypothetical protein OXK82_13375 [Deltaproteobacteria bacterium]|nr:hypothetical protein [Deltaproteobacteria bacterium]
MMETFGGERAVRDVTGKPDTLHAQHLLSIETGGPTDRDERHTDA